MSAAYQLDFQMTDDETLVFSVALEDADGNPPSWSSYTFDYALSGNGVELLLTEGAGLTVGSLEVVIMPADPTYRLPAGTYSHGFRVKDDATGITTQYFDGTVTVSEGAF